ncbi:MAG: hypothetical protein ACI9FD_002365 [Gammaproteobacteria bacterium]|jgi:hypothetical protein
MKNDHKSCYGTMFHKSLNFEVNKEMGGKVFSFELDSIGLGRSDRVVKVDISEWDDCMVCSEFDHCYRLCMARLALEMAIAKS